MKFSRTSVLSLQILLFIVGQTCVADTPLYITTTGTIKVSYSNVQDNPGGSGFNQIRLFVKKDSGSWQDTGVASTSSSGTLFYQITGADGSFYFSAQAKDSAGNLSAVGEPSFVKTVVLDSVAPTAGQVSAPSTSSSKTISINFSGASDLNSGLAKVELWRKIAGGNWSNTGASSTSSSGTFSNTVSSDGTYYYSTRAIDKAGNASATPSGNSGAMVIINSSAPIDSDNDGLSDDDEISRGTDPNKADSDGDGISDGQEVTDGTNPLDKGSMLEIPGTTVCTEWNGFLGGLWNILELVNRSNAPKNVTTVLYNISGQEVSRKSCRILSGGQCDVLIHDMNGRVANSFGKACSTHDGAAGDIDGRMVYYKQSTGISAQANSFEFAFAMPVTNGKIGDQFLPFNTYQPSAVAADSANPVANWIQITNISNTSASGKLIFYGQGGQVLGSQNVALAGGQRADFSGHQFGPSLVGVVAWIPNNETIPFSVRNVRYLYDNPYMQNSFATAFQLEGLYGSKDLLGAPLDTRGSSAIVEILNTSSVSTGTTIKIYTESGELKRAISLNLPANGSYHLITDDLLGLNKRGIVTAKSTGSGNIAVVAMQYKRNQYGAIDYMYGIAARPPVGIVLSGSYNTFLNQNSELVLVNSSSETEQVSVTVHSPSLGTQAGIPVSVPANGSAVLNINDFSSANEYGILEVQPEHNNAISAWVLRKKDSDYVMPTPVR
jgi:hypothetical protein